MNQTLALTTLGERRPGDAVNLEPALRAGEPLGGHFVQGHVDGVGVAAVAAADGIARRIWIEAPAELARYVAARGSIAVDGVSLTVSALDGSSVRGLPHPGDARADNAWRARRGRALQPRGGRCRPLRRAATH